MTAKESSSRQALLNTQQHDDGVSLPVLHGCRMRWKQDVLNDAGVALSVCIHP